MQPARGRVRLFRPGDAAIGRLQDDAKRAAQARIPIRAAHRVADLGVEHFDAAQSGFRVGMAVLQFPRAGHLDRRGASALGAAMIKTDRQDDADQAAGNDEIRYLQGLTPYGCEGKNRRQRDWYRSDPMVAP